MSDALPITKPLSLQDLLEGLGPASVPPSSGERMVHRLLQEQGKLSAVELFAKEHDLKSRNTCDVPDQARYYAKLLPATPVGSGQQYGFEVDLDRCSGCKACVTACHSLNGLDDTETWRDVGLLIGGTETLPVMQHVTAACHHCLEPACMTACPVNAYEKDTFTGIVQHLDDQCFGCQYCTLACPYNVPKYRAAKGIVRKCDMCSSRLKKGEAPACVQACPHEAIAIRIVDVSRVIENAEADHFLPAAPEPYITLPTTTYKTTRVFPRNMLPADYYSISPQHPHWPLIVMLVLTQLSVGAFAAGSLLEWALDPALAAAFRPIHATGALVLGLLALGASTLHLGRPLYAFRGILGFRHSWLSREIAAFGLFAGMAVPFAALCWGLPLLGASESAWVKLAVDSLPTLSLSVAGVGLVGVFCSVMIYVFTQRELWSLERTSIRFGLTTAILGVATIWLLLWLAVGFLGDEAWNRLAQNLTRPLAQGVIVATTLKLLYDISLLRHLATFRNSSLKRSALLVVGPLKGFSIGRLVLGVIGGIVIPAAYAAIPSHDPIQFTTTSAVFVGLMWAACLGGELLERYLFFSAVSNPRMPGGVRP
jgi:Fe-S-cluster-containing dehydrogenase component/DMSO reductase anchor subunit